MRGWIERAGWAAAFAALFALGWVVRSDVPPLEAKLASLTRDARPKTQGLLIDDAYAREIFTDPAAILDSRPRGVSADDDTPVHVGFIPPMPAARIGCEEIPTDRLAVILLAGQSNAENSTPATDLYVPQQRFYNLNIEDGGCYVAGTHAFGTTGHGSSFVLPLADELLANRAYANVLVVPIAVGGTYIEEWRPDGGRYFGRFERAIGLLAGYRLAPTFILWQHGEGNALPVMRHLTIGLFGDGRGARPFLPWPALREAVSLNYQLRFYSMVGRLRAMGVTAPILASVSTTCGYERTEPSIRAAQQALADPAWGVHPGVDTDAIPYSERYDGCHFGLPGIRDVAKRWAARLITVDPDAASALNSVITNAPAVEAGCIERGPAQHRGCESPRLGRVVMRAR